MTVTTRRGNLPHIKWIDLAGNGVLTECAVLKEDTLGNIYYVEIPSLDNIDKQRISRIISNRNANNFELWDLMSQITLNNGVNALEYFHQLVKVITPDGIVMNPKVGVVGTGKASADGKANTDVSSTATPVTKTKATTKSTAKAK